MAHGVIVTNRIVSRIGKPIKRRGIGRVGHHRIRLNEMGQRRVEPASAVVVQPNLRQPGELTRVAVVRRGHAARVALIPIGRVPDLAHHHPRFGVRHHTNAPQVVTQQKVDRAAAGSVYHSLP
ncbi:hypothetical protein ATHL_00981 [Anaerolinea thermolimosa]|nr:hypothetical protein ATHL_00981 [Anaerolinea thermolimosa]